jgi:molybdate transport system permease protein
MDWQALSLSLQLAAATVLLLLPLGICLARPAGVVAISRPGGAGGGDPAATGPAADGSRLLPAARFWQCFAAGPGYHALTGRALVFTFDGCSLRR